MSPLIKKEVDEPPPGPKYILCNKLLLESVHVYSHYYVCDLSCWNDIHHPLFVLSFICLKNSFFHLIQIRVFRKANGIFVSKCFAGEVLGAAAPPGGRSYSV